MCARHRLSRLHLRQGSVDSGGQAWTESMPRGCDDSGSTHQCCDELRVRINAVLTMKTRRDRLEDAIAVIGANSELPVVR